MSGSSKTHRLLIVGFLAASLVGCGGDPNSVKEDINESGSRNKRTASQGLASGQTRETGSMFGPGGLFGAKSDKGSDSGTGIAVNAFLWRASLDTINFIPLASADPFGGVIITDWYTPTETPNERMKVQVTILDRELRADGVRVSVFKQSMTPKTGGWIDDQVDPHTNTDIENAILTRARQLRIAQGGK